MRSRLILLLVGSSALIQAGDGFPSFVDVSSEVGITLMNVSGSRTKEYIVEMVGNGAGFFDYDRDGDIDLLITNGSTLEAYRQGGSPMLTLYENMGGQFLEVTAEVGLDGDGWGVGVCVADYNNDGYPDVYLTAYGTNVLYRNQGGEDFEDVTARAGVGDPRWSTNCAFGDYDKDGDLDLYVANYVRFDEASIPGRGESERSTCQFMGAPVLCGPMGLEGEPDTLYRNDGDGTFTDVTVEAGIQDPGLYGFGVIFSDLNNDGWPDIYVANDSRPNFLFLNNEGTDFSEIGVASGTALNERGAVQAGMGADVGDYDRNGYLDIVVTNFARDTNTLYQNVGSSFFRDATATAGMGRISRAYLGWGVSFTDLDNDGWEDIFVANGHVYPGIDTLDVGQRYRQPKEVYRNLGNALFEEVAQRVGGDLLQPESARGAAVGDYDNDGDMDIVAINIDDFPSLYRNDGGNERNWVSFQLEGGPSNRDGIGARIEIELGGTTRIDEVRSGGSYLSHNDMRVHFGLGEATEIDRVRIAWPSGQIQNLEDVASNQFLTVREGVGIVGRVR